MTQLAEDAATEVNRVEYVYLIGSEDSPLVKIGRSIDVPRRLADIQRMSPAKLSVLWQAKGGAELETALHRRFKAFRSHGEWFTFPGQDAPEQVVRAISEMIAEEQRKLAEHHQRIEERQRRLAEQKRKKRVQQKARKVWRAPRGRRPRKVHPGSRLARQIAEAQKPQTPANTKPNMIVKQPSQYRQVAALLRKEIESGIYPDGCLLPAEPDLAKELKVTRPVVNRALSILRKEGLVRPRRGIGTTVTYNPRIRRTRDFTNSPCSFREVIRTRAPEPAEARALGIDDDQLVMAITKTTVASEGRAVEVTELLPAHRIELHSKWSADQWLPETW